MGWSDSEDGFKGFSRPISAVDGPHQNRCFDTSQIPRLEPVGTGTHSSDNGVNQDLAFT